MANYQTNLASNTWMFLLLAFLWSATAQNVDIDNNRATNVSISTKDFGNNSRDLCNMSTTFQIPSFCMYVVFNPDHFWYDFVREYLQTAYGTNSLESISNIKLPASGNETIQFCFPLTPQLLNCELRKFGPNCYEIHNHKLLITDSNVSVELGDYYLDSNKNNAFTCAEVILQTEIVPRCNHIKLDTWDYVFNADGSIYINATNTTVQKPQYQVDKDFKMTLCFPLSIQFLNCQIKFKMTLHQYMYDWIPGLKTFFRSYGQIYSVNEYYPKNNGGDLFICAPKLPKIEIILRQVYTGTKCLSLFVSIIAVTHQLMYRKITIFYKCTLGYFVSGGIYLLASFFPAMECYSFYVLIYLTSNMAFVWLNITCFEVWRTFSNLEKCPNQTSHKRLKHQYLYYSIIGWGLPILLCTITLLLNNYYSSDNMPFLSPYIGINRHCWYRTKWMSFVFHFGFHIAISLLNSIFFVHTIYTLHKTSKGTEIVNKNKKREMYVVRVKLFALMGLTMIAEGIVWTVQEHYNFPFWYITDPIVGSQGLFVVAADICKIGALRAMRDQFRETFGKLFKRCTAMC